MRICNVFSAILLAATVFLMLTPLVLAGKGSSRADSNELGYWSFDNVDGADIPDSSGSDKNGRNYGAGETDGIRGKGLLFDGESTYASFPAMNIEESSFTLEAWIYPDPEGTQQYYTIFDDGTYYNDHRHRLLLGGPSWNPGELLVQFDGNFFSSGVCNWSEWNQVVYVFDINVEEERFYINGQLMGVHSVQSKHCYFDSSFYIGTMKGEDGYHFKGSIDEVRVYNSALTDSQILSNYNSYLEPVEEDDSAPGFGIGLTLLALSTTVIAVDRIRKRRT